MFAPRRRSCCFRSVLAALVTLAALAPTPARASGAEAGASPSPIEPRVDPVDGRTWRGDQMHARSLVPKQDGSWARQGVYRADDVRWGFEPPKAGRRWWARFAPTEVDPSKVTRALLVMNPFHPKASHAALVFQGPGVLRRLDTGETEDGLVLSVEGRVGAGQAYSLWVGLHGEYPLIYQLSTWGDYVQHIRDIYGGRLEPYVLELTPEEAQETARQVMETSLDDHRGERYQLLRASCTTAALDLLFEGIRGRFQGSLWGKVRRMAYRRKWLGGVLTHPSMSLPHRVPGLLDRRGLIRRRLPDVEPATP